MNRLFEETFASAPRRTNSSGSSSFRAPRRYRSSDGILDGIGEGEEFVPRKPRRCKSKEELDAALLSWDSEEDALKDPMVSSLCSNMEAMELDMISVEAENLEDDEASISGKAQHSRRPSNLMRDRSFDSNCSFYSIGSNLTLAQELHPGRFITPMNSFTSHERAVPNTANHGTHHQGPLECAGVQPKERLTVDPMKFVTADVSFRLPLMRNDSLQHAGKKREKNPVDKQQLRGQHETTASSITTKLKSVESPSSEKRPRRTITLEMALGGGLPSMPFSGADATAMAARMADDPTLDDATAEPATPPAARVGLKRKTSIYRLGA